MAQLPRCADGFAQLLAGDIRPEDNVWIGPVIEATLELLALERPFAVVLRFHDRGEIERKNSTTAATFTI
jgi:hypothetical protein